MRILMTTDTVGGVWTFTQELVTGLLRGGCAVCLVSIGEPPLEAQQEWCDRMKHQWEDRFHFDAVEAPLEWMQDNEGAYHDAAPRLLELAKTFGAELVHSNQFCFGALPLEIPKIVTAHSDVLSWAEACCDGVLEPSEWLSRYSALVSKGLRSADAIVAPTRWMATSLLDKFALSYEPIMIPNGRSLPSAERRTRKLQAVAAGRLWDEGKNIAMLVGVESPLPLFVAGDTHHGTTRMAGTLGHAILLGRLASDELFALFRESALYICTSKYEPFGLAPLEAALCGCAVLAYDIPSLREVWGDGALYFHDSASLAALLGRLCDAPSQLQAAQHASASRASSFTAERMSGDYYRLFERTLVAYGDMLYAS
ncbi:MAG: glycosyltransferase family 4 protein [Candidatus Sulfotelmatobacter sp.]